MIDSGPPKSSLQILIADKEKTTYKNGFGREFTLPKEVYSNKTYREKLDAVNTQSEVNGILYEYYLDKKLIEKKKKHWWQ